MRDEFERAVGETKQQFIKLGKYCMEQIRTLSFSIGELIGGLIDSLEPYQKYEILHPKKKPRGSIRRNKKKR